MEWAQDQHFGALPQVQFLPSHHESHPSLPFEPDDERLNCLTDPSSYDALSVWVGMFSFSAALSPDELLLPRQP